MERSSLVHITLNICIHATDNCLIQKLVFSKTRGVTCVLILPTAFSRNKTRENGVFFSKFEKKCICFYECYKVLNMLIYLCECVYVYNNMFKYHINVARFLKDATFRLIEQLNIFNMLQYRPDPT